MLGIAVDWWVNVETTLLRAVLIGLEFIIEVVYVFELLASTWAGVVIGGAPGIGAEVNASGLAIVITALALELYSPVALKESIFC